MGKKNSLQMIRQCMRGIKTTSETININRVETNDNLYHHDQNEGIDAI